MHADKGPAAPALAQRVEPGVTDRLSVGIGPAAVPELRVLYSADAAAPPGRRFVPRPVRVAWSKSHVLFVGSELPAYARGERGFHVIGIDALDRLLRSPVLSPENRSNPVLVVPDRFVCDPSTYERLRILEDRGVPVVTASTVARQRCRLEPFDTPVDWSPRRHVLRSFLRRAFDIVAGLVGCVLTLLVLPVVVIAIRLEDRGGAFYLQERVGRHGRIFRLIKFRSMRPDAEVAGPEWATVNDSRITRVGAVLRRYRIDELPQFVNVLVGQMSIVGPRPERPYFVELLRRSVPDYDVRHSVRPGITGWGTVKVGYGNSIEAKYLAHQFDLYHMKNRSFSFDIEIIFRSLRLLFAAPHLLDRFML